MVSTERVFIQMPAAWVEVDSRTKVSPKVILKTVADYFHVKVEDVISFRRHKECAHARQIAIYLMRLSTSLSLKQIGLNLGGRDHTSIIYSVNSVQDLMDVYPNVKQDVEFLTKKLSQYN